MGVGEAKGIELRVPDLVQLEVQDAPPAHAKMVLMDFARWLKPDLQWPAMDGSFADLLQVVALDHDREVRVAVLVCRQRLAGRMHGPGQSNPRCASCDHVRWMDAERRRLARRATPRFSFRVLLQSMKRVDSLRSRPRKRL